MMGEMMNIRNKFAACAAGAMALLLAACGQKESAPPPVEAQPVAAAPTPANEGAHPEASPHGDVTAHDAASGTAAPAQGMPPKKGDQKADPNSDMAGMKMPK
ncbi:MULTISPECIES: hypothetical protein [unclassified Phenylobacterium]|jgi:hypothetical protein|uniref:hypothetical protein n=1 Tax=unclassified Phenylobacterium TaxID=2640670 RepID=UPI00083BA445|nr:MULTISPECIES: hypothetical protein [unclassified Phenylobacterium]